MSPEIHDFIERSQFCQGAIRELAGMLPADDDALDALIAETVAASDQIEFVFIVLAALSAGRRVPGRHLARGTILLSDKITLGVIACHMDGDIAGPLIEAVTRLRLASKELISSALYLAARWQTDHGV